MFARWSLALAVLVVGCRPGLVLGGATAITVATECPVRYQTRNANSPTAPTAHSAWFHSESERNSCPMPSM